VLAGLLLDAQQGDRTCIATSSESKFTYSKPMVPASRFATCGTAKVALNPPPQFPRLYCLASCPDGSMRSV
jgi:hypothetical protein